MFIITIFARFTLPVIFEQTHTSLFIHFTSKKGQQWLFKSALHESYKYVNASVSNRHRISLFTRFRRYVCISVNPRRSVCYSPHRAQRELHFYGCPQPGARSQEGTTRRAHYVINAWPLGDSIRFYFACCVYMLSERGTP